MTPDLSRLRQMAEAARADSPAPWAVTPRERGPYGWHPSELVDANGDWVANFDGHHEQEFSAAANPSVVISLIDQVEAQAATIRQMQARLDRWEPRVNVDVGRAVVGDARCNKTLAGEGKAYPRTCMVCRLGPCRADIVAYKMLAQSLNAATDREMDQALSTPSPNSGSIDSILSEGGQ